MSPQEGEAVKWLALLGLVMSVIVLRDPGPGLLLTFALALWLHKAICEADIKADINDKTEWW